MVEKSARLHRDLGAHKCIESSGKENWRGYIGTWGPMNALNLVVWKLARLHKDLQAYECGYKKICGPTNVVTKGLACP
jgi:hypothetical protein